MILERALPVFDQQQALHQCFGSERILQQMAAYLLDHADRLLDEIAAAVQIRSTSSLRSTAHQLKGTVLHLAAPRAALALKGLEQLPWSDEMTDAAAAVEEAARQVQRLKIAVSPWRNLPLSSPDSQITKARFVEGFCPPTDSSFPETEKWGNCFRLLEHSSADCFSVRLPSNSQSLSAQEKVRGTSATWPSQSGSPGPASSFGSFRASRLRVCSSRRGPAGHSGRPTNFLSRTGQCLVPSLNIFTNCEREFRS